MILFADREKVGQRLWPRVDKSGGPEACWLFTGYCGEYGQLTIDGEQHYAHRLAWELTYGAIPERGHVLHSCDNPPCCNPSHLFLGTPKVNALDRSAKGRNQRYNALKTNCPKGHEYNQKNTYVAIRKGKDIRHCRECHRVREFGRNHALSA